MTGGPLLELQQYVTALLERGFKVSCNAHQPTGNPAASAEAESSSALGRITVWGNGLWDFEIISIASGETILWDHLENPDEAALDTTMRKWETALLTSSTPP